MLVDGIDNFENLVPGIEIFGYDGAAKSGPLVRNKITVYITSGHCGDNDPTFFYDKGSVRESVFGVIV